MEHNKWGLIRHKDLSLIALPLLDTNGYPLDVSQCYIEEIIPEFIDGYNLNGSGQAVANASYKYAWIDANKYDYVIFPLYSDTTNIYSGRAGNIGGSINGFYMSGNSVKGYAILPVTQFNYFVGISCLKAVKDEDIVVIGIKRHRSDNVNPLGVIQPLNPGELEPINPEDQEER